jgi:exodeoxyribonuclease V gamma subunit
MRDEWTIDPDRGLWLFRASRLEALLDPLEALLTHLPPASLLAPQTVLVGHPGLRAWLQARLAERRGPGGIVANLDVALPSPWLDALALSLGGEALLGVRPWAREVLRWRLWQALPGLNDPRVEALLARDADGAERFALAARLASALTPLLVYRLDWLQAWERGARLLPAASANDESLLAAAWRALRTPGLPRHRGEGLRWLLGRLRAAAPGELADAVGANDGPLHVFGLNHLPPLEREVLQALSRHRPVVFHLLDPCAEDWLGMGSGRQRFREALADEDVGESRFLTLDHPLLAAWGRLGQHFLLGLEAGEVALHERAGADARDADDMTAAAPMPLLARLQRSLRRNDPERLAGPSPTAGDASLRVVACATPLRELEVLRDALAQAFMDLPGLQPADIVVLSPQLERYRALVPAVFGEAARRDAPWPWRLADVPLSATHPLYAALRQALALPGQRLTAPLLVDLLRTEALARRFGLEGRDVDALAHALARLGVAWGLDAADRARFGVPAMDAHGFAWGLDRALAAHVFGDDDAHDAEAVDDARVLVLPDGAPVVPARGIDAAVADVLGRAHGLLLELREWIALAGLTLDGEAWRSLLTQRIDALFDVKGLDPASREALEAVRTEVAALAAEWRDAGLSHPLPFAAVRAALLERLDAVPERQRFLEGGITFCGMVPQRAIPFRVVAVLGLDEGALPRQAADAGLDLRRRHPRAGDRDLALDDRYLFLETVLAARERLHLSWIGIGAQDGGERNPAAPLAELLATLQRFAGGADGAAPWRQQAALQPPAWRVAGDDRATRDATASTASTASTPVTIPPPAPLDPSALLRFFRDPARAALRDGMGVRLDALEDDALPADEPLAPRADPRDTLSRRLALIALERGEAPPESPPAAWTLAGRLPAGELGAALWRSERDDAVRLLGRLASDDAVSDALGAPLPQESAWRVAIDLDGLRIDGAIAARLGADGGATVLSLFPKRKADELHFGQTLPAVLAWLLLRLTREGPVRLVLFGADGLHPMAATANALDEAMRCGDAAARGAIEARLRGALRGLLAFRDAVLRGERRYLPKTSFVAIEGHDEKTRLAWAGGDASIGERDHAPGYAALWAHDWGLDDELDDAGRVRLGRDAVQLLQALSPLHGGAA